MSWIVSKDKLIRKKNGFDKFVLISTPKCGGMSLEKYLLENNFKLSRPKDLNLVGHFTFIDTYLKLQNTKYEKINNYLIPYRNSIEWRKSFYKYVKKNPSESGMPTVSSLFNKITFQDYIEMLVSNKFIRINTIENLAFIPMRNYISNFHPPFNEITNIVINLYNMSNGFSQLFKEYLDIELDESEIINSTQDSENYELNKQLLENLQEFDCIDDLNKNIYNFLN